MVYGTDSVRPSTHEAAHAELVGQSSRQKILDAAARVALGAGILAMTLDAVAREAGVSKGGLIHHFRTKDDLIGAMLEDHSAKVRRALEARVAGDANPRGRWLRAFVQVVFGAAPPGERSSAVPSEMSRLLTAILAASANNPRLLDPIREHMRRLRERLLDEGPNGLRQVALWPAVYGLLLWQHLGIIASDDPLRETLLDQLLRLAEGSTPPSAHEEPGDA